MLSAEIPGHLDAGNSFAPAAQNEKFKTAHEADNNHTGALEGGRDENLLITANALAIQAKRKKKDGTFLLGEYFQNQYGLDDIGEGNLYPWSGRLRRSHGDVDKKRKPNDADARRANDADGRRVAVDEDGKRVVIDKEGRIATDAEGRRIVIDERYRITDGPNGTKVITGPDGRVMTEADGFRLVDGPNGSKVIAGPDNSVYGYRMQDVNGMRVVVGPDGRVLNGADGKALTVAGGDDLRIQRQNDGTRVAVDARGKTQLTMSVAAEPVTRVTPGADIETVRATVPDPVPDSTPRTVTGTEADPARIVAQPPLASDFRTSSGVDTARFNTFIAQQGMSLEDFQQRITASLDGPAVPRGAQVDIPADGLDVGRVRTGRFVRMLTPNGFDVLLAGSVGTYVTAREGLTAGAFNYFTGGTVLSATAATITAGGTQGALAAGETLPIAGTTIAYAQGRTAEGTVRAIEDVVEFASPFAFAAIGAGGGAAVGSAGAGIGAIPGAVVGFLGGLVVGVGVSLTASEATRAIARGLGYDDVDRGMIGSWFAPEYAEQMEGWIKSMSGGTGWREGESLSQVMERINANATTTHERTANFRELLDRINVGIADRQRQQIESVAPRITRDTGIDNLGAALRLPEVRAQITAFYRQQATENPNDQEIAGILTTLADYERTEAERIKVVAARTGADMMDAREINEALTQNLDSGLSNAINATIAGEQMAMMYSGTVIEDPIMRGIRDDLAAINFEGRIAAIRTQITASNGMSANDVITRSFANGTDAYTEMGTSGAMIESYSVLADAEKVLSDTQAQFVTQNWDALRTMMTANEDIETRWYELFSSNTTLGAELQRSITGARSSDTSAQELRTLMEESNNLANLTPEMAQRLLNNDTFRRHFMRAIEDNPQLSQAFRDSGFETRGQLLRDVRGQMASLRGTAQTYGFSLESGTDAGMTLKPRHARELVTETEPQAPKPQPH